MKKFVIVVIAVIILLVAILGMVFMNLSKEKTSISSLDFKNIMQEKGYTISDATGQFADFDYVQQVYVAQNINLNYQIEFYEFSDDAYAIEFYNNNREIFESSKSSASTETSSDLKNSSKYTLSSNGKYMVVSRINNTAIYVDVPDDNRDTVKKILKELGY